MSAIIKISDEVHRKLSDMKRKLSVIKHKNLSFNDLIYEMSQIAVDFYDIPQTEIDTSLKIKTILKNTRKNVESKNKDFFLKLEKFYKNIPKNKAIADIDVLSHEIRWI